MRLRKTLNRRVGDKAYHRWRFENVPDEVIAELGWIDGEALETVAERGVLKVRKVGLKSK